MKEDPLPKNDTTAEAPAPETTEDTAAKRAALLEQLASLPPATPTAGLQPGTKIGEGVAQEYVPYTADWFTDVETRKKDLDENGLPKWPNYQLHSVIPASTEIIRVNGVGFQIFAGLECKLPSPHYNVYKDMLEAPKRLEREFAPPVNPVLRAGYISPPHKMGDGPLRKDDSQ